MKTLSISEIRRSEAQAVKSGISEYSLMLRAGKTAAEIINQECSDFSRAVILCGSGNNGGDALVAAANLKIPAIIYATCPKERLHGCAGKAVRELPETIPFYHRESLSSIDFQPGDVIIDGLLGIGYSGLSMRKNYANFIEMANNSKSPIYSLDLPSGLNGDSGCGSINEIIHAECTIVFGALKRGLFSKNGSYCRGRLHYADINLPCGKSSHDDFEVYTQKDAVDFYTSPSPFAYKNSRGQILIVAGSKLYPGAAALATLSAMRSGGGMVRLATVDNLNTALPHAAICRRFTGTNGLLASDTWSNLTDFTAVSDVLIFGPGLGGVSKELLIGAINFPGPVVIDADGLNLIAGHPDLWKSHGQAVITPHWGEAERLARSFGIRANEGRLNLALNLSRTMQVITVLKGRDTIVADPQGNYSINSSGNSNLATAGSGDVLTGTIGALLLRLTPYEAARLGVYVHGAAGEQVPGLIADDLPELIGKQLKAISFNKRY